jgi:rod shape-determining protein MreC
MIPIPRGIASLKLLPLEVGCFYSLSTINCQLLTLNFMFTLRRWWDKNGGKAIGSGVIIAIAALVIPTQSGAIFELYHTLSQPFNTSVGRGDRLNNAQIAQLRAESEELKRQNQQLKQLLGDKALPSQGILAPIVLRSPDNWWQQITVGKGSKDGVKVNDIALGIGGLVGRVTQVTPHTSRILLASDPNSRMGVLIARSRSMGFVRGARGDRAILQFFDKLPDVKPGDTVMTSALSQLFPPGLPVAKVMEVNLKKAPAPEAIVEFTAPFSDLEWVAIHPPHEKPESLDLPASK